MQQAACLHWQILEMHCLIERLLQVGNTAVTQAMLQGHHCVSERCNVWYSSLLCMHASQLRIWPVVVV